MLRAALSPNGPFAAMAQYKQFVLWKPVPGVKKDGTPKTDKFPVDPKDFKVKSAHDKNIWVSASEALDLSEKYGLGVAFVFTESDPFFFIDVDKALVDGAWNAQSTAIYQKFYGAAFENSQSKLGFHIFGKYSGKLDHGCDNPSMKLGFYTEKRFVALTGYNVCGDVSTDWTEQLRWLTDKYFPPKVTETIEWTDRPVEGWDGIKDDKILIEKAKASQGTISRLTGKASFADLWEGRGGDDASSNDMALAQHLAFWTGNNCERIKNLMFESGLVRDKWTDREDYLYRTITRACSMQKKWHGMYVAPIAPSSEPEAEVITNAYMTPTAQDEYFAGCVYLRDLDRILVPDGGLLKQPQFNSYYGGYNFQVETDGKVTKSAWEAFTQSRVKRFPKANMTCFRPELPFGRRIKDESGRELINVFKEIDTPKAEGDVSPFLNHLEKMLPDERDRKIIINYLAAIVQHKGEKFQWAPLIQGAHGNGKTLLTRALEFAIGSKYTHKPNAHEIGEKFNGWLLNKVFIAVEDIKINDRKLHVLEILKPMITSESLEIRLMGTDKTTEEICCNFIFNSNHKDAIMKERSERRFAIFYCAQQCAEDLKRDGMGGTYFPKLYKWMNSIGYKRVNHFLHNYKIDPEFNPAVRSCEDAMADRAPRTSSEDEVNLQTMGRIEEMILDSIQAGALGFSGGFVSSTHLNKMFGDRVKSVRYRDIMKSIGYVAHPGLNNGRSTRRIPCDDNNKSIIYVDSMRSDLMAMSGSVIIDEYLSTQQE